MNYQFKWIDKIVVTNLELTDVLFGRRREVGRHDHLSDEGRIDGLPQIRQRIACICIFTLSMTKQNNKKANIAMEN